LHGTSNSKRMVSGSSLARPLKFNIVDGGIFFIVPTYYPLIRNSKVTISSLLKPYPNFFAMMHRGSTRGGTSCATNSWE